MTIEKLHEFCANHKTVYCYGAGRYGRTVLIHLQENGLDIESFLITGKPDGKDILGKPVYSIKDVAIADDSGIILAIGTRFLESMKKVLEQLNIQNYFVVDEFLLPLIEQVTKFDVIRPLNKYINVLMYHRVAMDPSNIHKITVSPKNFAAQMKYLKENFHVIRFDEDWTSVTEPTIVVTFDDGYADNFLNALPVLNKYGIPATFFVSTGNIDTDELFWWDVLEAIFAYQDSNRIVLGNTSFSLDEMDKAHAFLHDMHPDERQDILKTASENISQRANFIRERRSLTSAELRKMADSPLVTIGAHTVTHSSLSHEPFDMQKMEIENSAARLHKVLGIDINTFSYPFGDYNDDTLSILEHLRLKRACTVTGGLACANDKFKIPRNKVLDWDVNDFEKFLRQCWRVFA